MACFNCNFKFRITENTPKHLRPNQITCRLQDRKYESTIVKPNVNIIDAIEDIMEGKVTLDSLKIHAAAYICHECQVVLRQTVNKKAEVELNIAQLHEPISKVTNTTRRQYYKSNSASDRLGRCWACMYEFKKDANRKDLYSRRHLDFPLMEGITIKEGIKMLLEEEAESLHGLYSKKTYICKNCFALLKQVVKNQCLFDNLNTSFLSRTHEESLFAKIQRGEDDIPSTSNIAAMKSDCNNDGVHRPFHRMVGKLPFVQDPKVDKQDESRSVSPAHEVEELELSEEVETKSDESVSSSDSEETSTVLDNEDKSEGEDVFSQDEEKDEPKQSDTNIKILKNEQRNKQIKRKKKVSRIESGAEKKARSEVNQDHEYFKDAGKTLRSNKSKKIATERTMSDEWVLYYYPKFAGRAEFVRLLFEETGVEYRMCGEGVREKIVGGEMEGYPHFAPPMLKKGDLQLSQTPVICRYLGEVLGLYPDTLEDRLHAEQVSQCCHDYIAEGRLAFHGIHPTASYFSQQEGTQPYIDRFVTERMQRWLSYFERVLKQNNNGEGFLFGTKITYADLGLFQILRATEAQFPDAYKKADYMPSLKAFSERIASRQRLKVYFKSDRYLGFSGDSMM